ncbi:lipoprotein [Geomonas silvestris]|uniref:Lipoprotein n=1 Tax=Geomonas silvestris TaxID=2740184 RepID=A0A6V8MQS8_9BACT|nr:hypothetical protein [Geomonas silvestris]GFO62073.1 lipoprotein [Geomonas silvestris]
MKKMLAVVLAALLLGSMGCAGDKAKELFETAQFEEKQHNNEHAEKLYNEIVSRYPDSVVAKQAQERLAVLKKK